ncbi:MAG: hypothetical protein GY750_11335, partial [Lentisphaerae bacterium]|nr:hypothetical protein [Lentisphaerota bacterium]
LKVGKLKLGDNGLELDNVRKRVQAIAEKLLENPELIEEHETLLKIK